MFAMVKTYMQNLTDNFSTVSGCPAFCCIVCILKEMQTYLLQVVQL